MRVFVASLQVAALLFVLLAVTSAQEDGERAKVVHELDALLEVAASENDQLTDQEKVEVDVVRQLKDALVHQGEGGVAKRSVDEMRELVRRKRFPWAIAGASALAGYLFRG